MPTPCSQDSARRDVARSGNRSGVLEGGSTTWPILFLLLPLLLVVVWLGVGMLVVLHPAGATPPPPTAPPCVLAVAVVDHHPPLPGRSFAGGLREGVEEGVQDTGEGDDGETEEKAAEGWVPCNSAPKSSNSCC